MEEPIVTSGTDPTLTRIIHGVSRLADLLRNRAWAAAREQGLTPTQGKILVLLRLRDRSGLRLSRVADEIAVTPATASDAVATLAEKELVEKRPAAVDARALAVTLTYAGRREAYRAMHWSDFLLDAFETLTAEERRVMLRGLSRVLLHLGEDEEIPMPRICLACGFFLPSGGEDEESPHRCDFGDFDFGDEDLRIDCSVFEEAASEEGGANRSGHEAREGNHREERGS